MKEKKKKHWMDGFSSREEELNYWKEEGEKYANYLKSQKKINTNKNFNLNMSDIDIEFNFSQ